jgi:type IV secretory pathway VirB10-like protein
MPAMKFRTAAAIIATALIFVFGCADGEEPEEARKQKTRTEQRAEREFADRLAQRPQTPPEYVGPEPKWWWLNPDSPPNFIGPEPGWWRKAPVPPECVGPQVAAVPDTEAGAEEGVAETARPEKKKKTAVRAPVPARTEPRARAKPKSADQVRREFGRFANRFLDKMARNLRHSAANKEIVETRNGYVARFIHLEKDSMTLDVKPCEGAASYVGVMRYLENHYENECVTADCAKDGPFLLVKKVRFTEIFRYAGGRWHE